MTDRGIVSAADALRAVHALSPDREATAEVLAMLALERVAQPVRHAPVSVQGTTSAASPPPTATPPRSVADAPDPTESRRTSTVQGDGRPTVVQQLSTTADWSPPEWLGSATLLPEPSQRVTLVPEPIFGRTLARSIIAASVATRSADGPLDVRALVERLSRLAPVHALPRKPAATLRNGVQLLLDISSAMEPFTQDVLEIARVIEDVVGGPRTQRLRVQGPPLCAVITRAHREEPWRAPARGTPVLIVSDLGIGGDRLDRTGPRGADWALLATRARAAGCPVVALVPFGAAHWDAALMQLITHIHWDHRVTAGAIRRAIGPGHVVR